MSETVNEADAAEIIRQIKSIEIGTRKLVDGLISGNYHSVFRGQGVEFSDIREYRPGDDIRTIDWKVTARFNRPFVKDYVEERDLRVYFLLDVSASGSFGNTVSKRWKATEIMASLMFSAMRNNDNVGLLMFSNEVELFIPARKGRRHVFKLLSSLVGHTPESAQTDIVRAMSYFSKVVKRRSVVFIVSDFMSPDFSKELDMLKSRHDVIAIGIFDKRETEIPNVGKIELEDEETGEQILVDTSDEEFRMRYSELVDGEKTRLRSVFRKSGIDMIDLGTDEGYEVPLKKFFKQRQHRMVR